MVGTIEPRKGHLQALSAFDLLRKEGEEVNLLIVGREGWLDVPLEEKKCIISIVRKIRSHPELHRSLFWMDDADDGMLVRAYDSSTCLIFASEGEGFGLPLIEAARHGLPIIARDIPVFREVAGEHAFYFTGLQAEDLARAIRNWLELFRRGEHPPSRGIPWMTWKENVEQLKKKLTIDN
jgi:glycosyltransferase involved in cell wall biosynthesis